MKGEDLEFRDVYLKWGVIERQKHLKKLCKELHSFYFFVKKISLLRY